MDDKRDSLPMDPAPSSPELCDEDGGKSSALDEVAVDALMPGSLRERIEALEARCATCNLWTNVKRGVRACRCDKFQLALPLDLGYGDLVMCTTGTRPTEATALYFVYAGTKDLVGRRTRASLVRALSTRSQSPDHGSSPSTVLQPEA